MNGLLKNNFYAMRSNGKVFSILMVLLGIFAVAMDNDVQTLIDGYMLLGMIGFSLCALTTPYKENVGKWSKYKLTTPVKRSQIVSSYYISQLLWLLVGMIFAGVGVSLSIALHGYPFDRNTDLLMLFVVGISISLFMGAIFFPLFYLCGEERSEVFLVISGLCGFGIVLGLSTLINILFPHMTTFQIILGAGSIFAFALFAFLLSYPLSVWLFRKREY